MDEIEKIKIVNLLVLCPEADDCELPRRPAAPRPREGRPREGPSCEHLLEVLTCAPCAHLPACSISTKNNVYHINCLCGYFENVFQILCNFCLQTSLSSNASSLGVSTIQGRQEEFAKCRSMFTEFFELSQQSKDFDRSDDKLSICHRNLKKSVEFFQTKKKRRGKTLEML